MKYEEILRLVLEGIDAVYRNKGSTHMLATTVDTKISSLDFDSLDYAELILHVELATGQTIGLRESTNLHVVGDLARSLLFAKYRDE